jgi:hypothetical protein
MRLRPQLGKAVLTGKEHLQFVRGILYREPTMATKNDYSSNELIELFKMTRQHLHQLRKTTVKTKVYKSHQTKYEYPPLLEKGIDWFYDDEGVLHYTRSAYKKLKERWPNRG